MDTNQKPSLGNAALIAGLGILLLALTVPIAEFYIFPELINYRDAAETAKNISDRPAFFTAAIFIHLLSVFCDVVIAWALYIFLKPVDKNLALLTAWLRIAYAAFNVVALLNLVHVLALIRMHASSDSLTIQSDELILFYVRSFNMQWKFGLIFFGICMIMLGWVVLKAKYIPNIMGYALFLAGAGYILDDVRYFLLPQLNTDWLFITFLGELVFMAWLLVKGRKVKTI